MATQLFQPTRPATAHYGGVEILTAPEWISIKENPRQRDTETRAARAKHLRELHPAHCMVNMARLPNGDSYKLDGHTRAHLWAKGAPEGPATIYATVWECANIGQVKDLYGTFDSKAAVETVGDQVFGAVRDERCAFESELLGSNRFAGIMRVATDLLFDHAYSRDQTIYQLLEYWLPELRLLDECNPSRRRFHTGVGAAALVTLRRFGPNAQDFWKSFAKGGGVKMNGERDGVQALEERLESIRNQRTLTGRGNVTRVLRICLSAFDAYQGDYLYTSGGNGIKAMQDNSLNRWAIMAAKTKRTW
jgi:hypothetical protein